MEERIFVYIASYRDPSILDTIDNLLDNARFPDSIDIRIINQGFPFISHKSCDILNIHPDSAKGLGFARSLGQSCYNHQKFALQLDSHHTFTKNWDYSLINLWKLSDNPKAIISTYAHPINTSENLMIALDSFTPWGLTRTVPMDIPDSIKDPIFPSRFMSGHFMFGVGDICTDLRYDRRLYFDGDEIQLALRAYTHGYQIYTPNIKILEHDYDRTHAPRHWEDDSTWFTKDRESKRLVLSMINGTYPGSTLLGKVKSIQDYEEWAGIRFITREISEEVEKGLGICEKYTYREKKEYRININSKILEEFKDISILLVGDSENHVSRVEWSRGDRLLEEIITNEPVQKAMYGIYEDDKWTVIEESL